MAGPWEQYATPAQEDGPWKKYGGATPDPQPAQEPKKPVAELGMADAPLAFGISPNAAKAGLAGVGQGVGRVALTAQDLVGRGLNAIGGIGQQPTLSGLIVPSKPNMLQQAGQWLSRDANQGKANMEAEMAPMAANNPMAAGIGRTVGEGVATLPVGGALGAVAGRVGAAPAIVNALRTGGFKAGEAGAPAVTNMLTRMAGGAATGGATVGLIDPDHAGTGAMIGAALPPVLKGVGVTAAAAGRAIVGKPVSEEVANLAARAKELGIDLPADRLTNSKTLDSTAAALNYLPFSGRAATEGKMVEQMNTALSRTFGQDSPNVTQALRKASDTLGAKFDATLKSTGVKVDDELLNGMASVESKADSELGKDAFRPIKAKISEILEKGQSGQIDGQAAYNIKKDLDRIGNGQGNEAYHARELKKHLMGALDRSLGPDAAKEFATTRAQYGNMLDLENLAQNGAEGGISIGRLANLKNINNPDLKELADIASQFVKSREGNHSAKQTASLATLGMAGMVGGGPMGAALAAGGGMALGRSGNSLLNSTLLRNALLQPNRYALPQQVNELAGPALYRTIDRGIGQ